MKTTELKRVSTVGKKVTPTKFNKVKKMPLYSCNQGDIYSSLLEALQKDFDLTSSQTYQEFTCDEAEFSFDTEEVRYCCGVIEIGNINLDTNFPEKDVLTILEYLLSNWTKNDGKCYTFIINTNGKNDCIRFEKILVKSKHFALVKTFTNINSGSTIKMWISKN